MNTHIQEALAKLQETGIDHAPSSLKRHHSQGYISEVFTVSSSIGHLVLHLMRVTPLQEHIRAWEKLIPLSKLLREKTRIPVSNVLFVHRFPTHVVIVQTLLEGSNAGERDIWEHGFRDTWYEPFETYKEQMTGIIAELHSVPVAGFGWLRPDGDGLAAEHATWSAFLADEIPRWIGLIRIAEEERGMSKSGFVERAERFVQDVLPEIVYDGPPSIVHGDLISPTNVLVKNGKVSGIIDWEFGIAADPAWEFTHENQYPIEAYMDRMPGYESEATRISFRRRVEIYSYLPFLLWTATTSWDAKGALNINTKTILDDWLKEHYR